MAIFPSKVTCFRGQQFLYHRHVDCFEAKQLSLDKCRRSQGLSSFSVSRLFTFHRGRRFRYHAN